MRKFILIAGLVLTSATAQAADRSLSLSGVETQSVPAPAKASDTSRTAEAPPAAETPKYTERPAIVEPKAETTGAETQRAESPRRITRAERIAAQRSRVAPSRHSFRRTASMSRGMRPHRHYRLARIINALHRYGIYW
jgi:hypothetical protein